MSTTHAIPAAPWQLERSLELMLLPLVPEPRLCPLVDAGLTDRRWWILDEEKMLAFAEDMSSAEIVERLARYGLLSFHAGDRIYLQEPWCEFDDLWFTESTCPQAECVGWQPAHTMPEAAAEHWYTISDVRVCQCKNLTTCSPSFLEKLGWQTGQSNPKLIQKEWELTWNAAHPDHPWQGDRWVVAVAVEAISNGTPKT